jgi:hypothetical protein
MVAIWDWRLDHCWAATELQKGLLPMSRYCCSHRVDPVVLRREFSATKSSKIYLQQKLALLWQIFWREV